MVSIVSRAQLVLVLYLSHLPLCRLTSPRTD